ncbi:hypothetical protein D3C80_1070550 [compost metagenome]
MGGVLLVDELGGQGQGAGAVGDLPADVGVVGLGVWPVVGEAAPQARHCQPAVIAAALLGAQEDAGDALGQSGACAGHVQAFLDGHIQQIRKTLVATGQGFIAWIRMWDAGSPQAVALGVEEVGVLEIVQCRAQGGGGGREAHADAGHCAGRQ